MHKSQNCYTWNKYSKEYTDKRELFYFPFQSDEGCLISVKDGKILSLEKAIGQPDLPERYITGSKDDILSRLNEALNGDITLLR